MIMISTQDSCVLTLVVGKNTIIIKKGRTFAKMLSSCESLPSRE
jgi:hypothetical protein